MATNVNIGVINETDLSTQTQVGKILFTESGKNFIVKTDGSKLQITDIVSVSALPTIGIENKLYVLTTNYSLNYYDTSWHIISGSTSEQISIGTIAPSDTSKLFLNITDKIKPLLKWYDSTTTSWINISGNGLTAEQETKLNNLDLNYLGNNVKNNGAVGDNTTDATTAIQNTINLDNTVIVPSGKYKVTSIDNKYGKNIIGDGKVIKNGVLQNSYADKYQNIFGREYMSYAHKKIMNSQALKIVFSGDSTTNGDYVTDSNYKIYNLISTLATKVGFTNITTVNNGQSGHNTGEWDSTYYSTDLLASPDILVLRWGVNDASRGLSAFTSSLRSGLTKIRTSRPLANLSIILMTPNSTSDTPNGRDELWYEQINFAIRQACRDFQCVFIDTYQYLQDSRNASDWMDNPYSDGRHIHPLEVMNLWISSKIVDVIFPLSIRLKFGSVGGSNISDATSTNRGIVALAGDLSGTASSPTVNGIKGVTVDISNFEDNNVMIVDKINNKIKLMPIASAVTVGEATIIQPPSIITLTSGQEGIITHEESENIIIGVEEQIDGTMVNDLSTMDFSNANKYVQQDNTKTLINNKIALNISGYSTDLTPTLTSNTSDSTFVITASSVYSASYPVYYLFDKNNATQWVSSSGVIIGTITMDFVSTTKNIGRYTITARPDASTTLASPKTFTFQGSNDNSTWTILDTRSSETGWGNNETRTYTINSFQYFRYYRLNITANCGYATYLSFSGLALMTPTYYNNIYSYVSTSDTSNLSLSTIDIINYITIPVNIPTNTSVKWLFSVDNRTNWLYKDGTGIHKYTGSLTSDWTNYNSNTDLQTYFTNLNISQLTSDLSSLSITPTSLDFIQLPFTSDNTVTPTISPIIINYTTVPHNEFTSFGRYDDSNVTFGAKRINNEKLGIKNHTTTTRIAKVSILKGVYL